MSTCPRCHAQNLKAVNFPGHVPFLEANGQAHICEDIARENQRAVTQSPAAPIDLLGRTTARWAWVGGERGDVEPY